MEELHNDLLGLMSHRAPKSVSLYFSCTDAHHNPDAFVKHWKNAMRQVRNRLGVDGGSQKAELPALTPAIEALARRCQGLAVFFSDRRDPSIYPLSFAVHDHVSVSQRFHLKSILATLSWPRSCFVLALSQHSVRLLHVDRDSYSEVPLDPSMPTSIEAVQQTLAQPHLDVHSGRNGQGVFHGQDPAERRAQEDTKRFLRAVAHAVQAAIDEEMARRPGVPAVPLVLTGVVELTSAFRKQSRLWILDSEIVGSPEHASAKSLAHTAAEHARKAAEEEADRLKERIRQLSHTPRVKFGVLDVVRAANDGRVEALLLQDGASIWGKFDPERRDAEFDETPDDQSEDLLDRAAVDTYRQGGTVQLVEGSGLGETGSPAVALLRY